MGIRRGGSGMPAIGAALLVFLVGLVGLAVTLGSCESTGTGARQRTALAPPEADSTTRTVDEWLARTSRPALFAPAASRQRLLDDLVAPSARASVARGLRESAATFDTDQAAAAVVVATPMGVHVVRETETEATVDARQLVLRSEPAAAPVVALTSTRMDLTREDRWRIARLRVSARALSSMTHAQIRRIVLMGTEPTDVP